jgi:hypothetical protein
MSGEVKASEAGSYASNYLIRAFSFLSCRRVAVVGDVVVVVVVAAG